MASSLVVSLTVVIACTFIALTKEQEHTAERNDVKDESSRIRCYVGIKTEGGGLDEDERMIMRCNHGHSCLSVTARMWQEVEEVTIETGRCVPSNKCSTYTCENVFNFLPDVTEIKDCEISCCAEDLCNKPDTATTSKPQLVPKPVEYIEASCPPNGWTAWFNSDTDATDGDIETIPTLRARYPGAICDQPTAFQAINARTQKPYDGASHNILASADTGLECISFPGFPCEDHKIRFCCPKGLTCYTGIKTSGHGFNRNEQEEEQCPVGMLCADITAEVVFDPGNNFTSLESVGHCLLPETCASIGCDVMISDMLPTSKNSKVLSGECKCCDEDLCNKPHATYAAAPVQSNEGISEGIMCFTGVDVSQNASSSDVLQLTLKQCDPEQVCSDVEADISFPNESQPHMRFHQAQCLFPKDCETRSCEYISLLLPELIKMDNLKCKVSCCHHDRCNDPSGIENIAPDVARNVVYTTHETTEIKDVFPDVTMHSRMVLSTTPNTTAYSPTTRETTATTSSASLRVTNPPSSSSFVREDVRFLPSCSASHAVVAVFRCESTFANPIIYEGPTKCRTDIAKLIDCLRKELAQCLDGGRRNFLDSLQLPLFNSKNMSLFLESLSTHSDSTSEANINRFCFHAGMNFPYPYPVNVHIDGCENNVLDELLRRAITFYNKYAWARNKADICRAFKQLKQWFLEKAEKDCTFNKLVEFGYKKNTAHYLATLARVVINNVKKLNSTAC